MFPSIHIVMIDALDFPDFCCEFDIRIFPSIIVFKSGIKLTTIDGPFTPSGLASFLAKVTSSYPRAYPRSIEVKLKPKRSFIEKYEAMTRNASMIETVLYNTHKCIDIFLKRVESMPWLRRIQQFKTEPSVEPIAGSFRELVDHEIVLYFLSGIYVIVRFSFWFISLILSSTNNIEE